MGSSALDQQYQFGGGAANTTLTPATIALLAAAILLFFLLPRKYVIVPFLVVSFFIPISQVIVLGGLHFITFRALLPFAWIRALSGRSQETRFRFSTLDKTVILWALSSTICFTLLWGTSGAFVNRLGFLYNALGIYFLLRILIRDRDDVNRTIQVLALLCAILAVFMIHEQLTGRNFFSVFGGVPEFTAIRDGRLRSQGAFAHPIVAGTVGAMLLPLFVGLWLQQGKTRTIAIFGAAAAVGVVWASSSATPLLSAAIALGVFALWPVRRYMRLFRWAVVAGLVLLQIVMKAPVWALIQRVDVVGGSSGWHRYELINVTIAHFGEWWLVGMKNPSSWGYFMGDISNAYMEAAVSGGLLTLILFIGLFRQGFRALGQARKAASENRELELQIWSFAASLICVAAAFIGITFWDQSMVIWYALLAMICAITSTVPVSAARSVGLPVEEPSPWEPAVAEKQWSMVGD